ncbi:MAG: potassium transporter TrkA [Spirochaetes bacterium RIFOXYC1_FULL_54_7]|nr:MAG: potassium transporter TrkA [Spirochaetes bacterium RIFOXYC1_FULL_54_7]
MDQILVFITIGLALVMFVWGRFRHDLVSLGALLLLVILGIVPPDKAFSGFGNPAVVSVAAILIVSESLRKSGFVEHTSRFILKLGKSLPVQIFVLSSMVCITSAFMNNIGALAIFMPVAIHITRKSGHAPSSILMPLAFASLLGGLTTMIGTPPNILISAFRMEASGRPFSIFDYAPVGLSLSLLGIVFITTLGWRLLPHREGATSKQDRFNINAYITELRITEGSPLIGLAVRDVQSLTETRVQVLGLIRPAAQKMAGKTMARIKALLSPLLGRVEKKKPLSRPEADTILHEGDIIVIETDSTEIREFIKKSKTVLVGDPGQSGSGSATPDNDRIAEVVILPDSALAGKTTADIRMRARYGVSLLAIARQDRTLVKRLDKVELNAGDVLLLKGRKEMLDERILAMGCLPLADRGLSIEQPKLMALAIGIFGSAIALVITNILPLQIAFALAAVLVVATGVLPVQEMWTSVDWPVIMLLGALLPVGEALESSGGVETIARLILAVSYNLPVWGLLGILVFATMLLSAIINNAATVVLMAPVGISLAGTLGVSVDTFLMATAIGASASFLSPIAHQSNTLVMGPGGYKFSDYVRLGLPLSLLLCAASIPLLLLVWPL